MTSSPSSHTTPIGVAHFSAIQAPPSEFARLAAQAGFASIGLRLHPAFPGAPYYELPEGSRAIRDFRSLLQGEGISVFDIEFFIIDANFQAATVERIAAAASYIGARRLTACGDDDDRQRLVANLVRFCRIASKFDLSVDIENMGWRSVNTFADSSSLVQACNEENAGILIDAIHFFRNGGMVSHIDGQSTRVKHVQLCDAAGPAPGQPDDMIAEAREGRLMPGDGELPLARLLGAIPSSARLSVEVPLVGQADPKEHLAQLYLKTRRLLDRVRGSS
jgi:sugar phosphate isomerase/epimerase